MADRALIFIPLQLSPAEPRYVAHQPDGTPVGYIKPAANAKLWEAFLLSRDWMDGPGPRWVASHHRLNALKRTLVEHWSRA